jgi:hypothetical protein
MEDEDVIETPSKRPAAKRARATPAKNAKTKAASTLATATPTPVSIFGNGEIPALQQPNEEQQMDGAQDSRRPTSATVFKRVDNKGKDKAAAATVKCEFQPRENSFRAAPGVGPGQYDDEDFEDGEC